MSYKKWCKTKKSFPIAPIHTYTQIFLLYSSQFLFSAYRNEDIYVVVLCYVLYYGVL